MVFGRQRPPLAVRSLLDSSTDERLLAWAETDTGGFVAATSFGLWWPEEPARLITWHLIDKVVWSEAGFTVIEADLVDDLLLVDREPARVALERPNKLPEVVRRRVESSVVRTLEVELSDGVARIVGRKVRGQDGISYWARLESGTPDSPLTRLELTEIIEPLRAEAAARLANL